MSIAMIKILNFPQFAVMDSFVHLQLEGRYSSSSEKNSSDSFYYI